MRSDDGFPDWTQGNPEWAFNKETVSQMSSIAIQLEQIGFAVESFILYNNETKIKEHGTNLSIEEYQDCMDGLGLIGEQKDPDKNGFTKKVEVKTNANDDSIDVKVGFDGTKLDKNIELWNNGIYYSVVYSKDELGKFSSLWDRIQTNFLSNNEIIPLTESNRVTNQGDVYLSGFIDQALKNGYIKKVRVQDND